ncbi:MAG: hypothetical protein KDM81_09990, partial [Verrucomicrobiae bacterium]|nr:hypothetical protein [Verrucomicrobiae bacterium]
ELAIERVKHLDEVQAGRLLAWLQTQEQPVAPRSSPLGAQAMLGFARRFRCEPRTTAAWMFELREGEHD